jgi:hypothetical protein
MNAFNSVNLAGALILTSTEYAEELGIPKDKWVYVLGGAGTADNALRKSFLLACKPYHAKMILSQSGIDPISIPANVSLSRWTLHSMSQT